MEFCVLLIAELNSSHSHTQARYFSDLREASRALQFNFGCKELPSSIALELTKNKLLIKT